MNKESFVDISDNDCNAIYETIFLDRNWVGSEDEKINSFMLIFLKKHVSKFHSKLSEQINKYHNKVYFTLALIHYILTNEYILDIHMDSNNEAMFYLNEIPIWGVEFVLYPVRVANKCCIRIGFKKR